MINSIKCLFFIKKAFFASNAFFASRFLLRVECFNFLPEIIAFSPSKFWKHWLETKLILILSQKFHFMPEGSSFPTFQLCKWTTSGVPWNIPVAHCLPVSRIQLLCSLIPPWYIEFWRFLHPKYIFAALKYRIWHKCYQIIKPICSSPEGAAPIILSNLWWNRHLSPASSNSQFMCLAFCPSMLWVIGSWSKFNVTVIAQWSEHATSWRVWQSNVELLWKKWTLHLACRFTRFNSFGKSGPSFCLQVHQI